MVRFIMYDIDWLRVVHWSPANIFYIFCLQKMQNHNSSHPILNYSLSTSIFISLNYLFK